MTFISIVVLLLLFSGGVLGGQPTSISELKDALRLHQDGGACFKIFTRDKVFGCEDLSGNVSKAPVQLIRSLDDEVDEKRVLLMSLALFPSFANHIHSNRTLLDKISSILVFSSDNLESFSSESSTPEGVTKDGQESYEWNPKGNGLRFEHFSFPVFLLNEDIAEKVLHGAHQNHKRAFSGALYKVQTTMAMEAKENSIQCLEDEKCKPLGGYSILGITPQISHSSHSNDIILVISKLDSSGFFLDRLIGADSSLSSLIVMLSVIEILKKESDFEDYNRRIVFVAFAGESWDAMGSKRFLWEFTQQNNTVFENITAPFNLTQITQVIELGQVGNPEMQGNDYRFYLHEANSSQEEGVNDELRKRFLETAEETSELKVSLQRASESNPGLPPSSLEVLTSFNRSLEGILIEEFNTHFTNPFYNSIKDDEQNLNSKAISKIAILVAQTLHKLAMGDQEHIQIDESFALQTVEALIECLVSKDPGLKCELAQQLISEKTPSDSETSAADHYIGVLKSVDSNIQDSDHNSKSNTERFVFNYIGSRLGTTNNSVNCDFNDKRCAQDQVCIGHKELKSKEKRLGVCYNTSVYFIPSYSLLLKYNSCRADSNTTCKADSNITCKADSNITCSGKWEVDLNSTAHELSVQSGWVEDPIWTESDWSHESQSLEFSMVESKTTELLIFISGILLTLGTILVSMFFQSLYNKRVKAASP